MRLLLLNIAILLVVFIKALCNTSSSRFISKEIKYRSFYVCDRGREKERKRERERTRKRKQYHTSAANFLYNYSTSLFTEFFHLNVAFTSYFLYCDAIIFNISQLA